VVWIKIMFFLLAPLVLYWQYKDVQKLFMGMQVLYENQLNIVEQQRELAATQTEIIRELKIAPQYQVNPRPPKNSLLIVQTNSTVKYDKLDLFCMAKNIYHEAAHEPEIGRYAVAQVTLNRKMNPRYPKKICDVIMDPFQFSWANDKKIRWTHPKGRAWEEAKRIAEDVIIYGYRVQGLEHGLFYHADYVSPRWRDNSAHITQVGRHIFYSRAL
jgi:spore germination cell wall hydrolase CwlJ-like protein